MNQYEIIITDSEITQKKILELETNSRLIKISMNNYTKIIIFTILICLTVTTVQSLPLNKEETAFRHIRNSFFENWFKGTTLPPPTTTPKPILPNNIEIGKCEDDDKVRVDIFFIR